MTEVLTPDGAWTLDDGVLRIVPGHGRKVHKLRRSLGELAVPLEAISGIAFEQGRKSGRLRLRLRDGADPFAQVTTSKLTAESDPYGLAVDRDAFAAAGYLVDEVRHDRAAAGVPDGPAREYLMPPPAVPLTATAGDGAVSFDGTTVRIEWTEWAEDSKLAAGTQVLGIHAIEGVEWTPIMGLTNGSLRFRRRGVLPIAAKNDLACVTWGILREGGTTSLVAAAIAARLPHPHTASASPPAEEPPNAAGPGTAQATEDEHDAVMRRLRELGDLHRGGVLDDAEFAMAKQALLRRL
ncbi:DUF4429 domain-containing protein [Patulibacter americanus]|uniref:DUF4429 domain-containing protein n=1 Tax=Patulibacter americanus TaxID=588672 RepID=UPI0003B71186|nr:DUF4429 domain-containing protein [Patulibacter americanus]